MGKCIVYSTFKGREFIEDQTEWAGKWDNKIMYYGIINPCRTLDEKQVRKALNLAMTTWDVEIDITFKPAWISEDVANITIDFKSPIEDSTFKDKPSILAYAYFPSQGSVSGKVVFNNDYIWSMDGKPITGKEAKTRGWVTDANDNSNLRTFNIITVLIHELGHSLGLRHDVSGAGEGRDVMDAFYDGAVNLSERDILRILLKYPARVYSGFNHYGRLKKWLARKKASL